jgi:hypothetical protein
MTTTEYETPAFKSCPVCGAENPTNDAACFTCIDEYVAA